MALIPRHTGNTALDNFQTSSAQALRSLQSSPLAGALLLEGVSVTTTPTPLNTGLEYVRGYFVVRSTAALTVRDEGIEGGQINLVASAAGTVSLLVF